MPVWSHYVALKWKTQIISLQCTFQLWNLGSWHSSGCDIQHPTKHCSRLSYSAPPRATLWKLISIGLKNMTKSLRCWPGLQTPQIPVQSSIHRCSEPRLIHRDPPCNCQDQKDLLPTFQCQISTAYLRRSVFMPWWVQAVLEVWCIRCYSLPKDSVGHFFGLIW